MTGKASYLLRFDDICPTMNWHVWEKIEALLVSGGVCPILAVVPDNADPVLVKDPPRADFWERVRQWQAGGWTIALHGLRHVYVNRKAGLIGVTPSSEFAGLPRAVQEAKLRRGLEIFAREKVRADCWIAPSHSFDRTTVELLAELGILAISDGLWHRPRTDALGITWVPQQLWNRPRPMPPGIWTVCCHHNSWDDEQVNLLAGDITQFSKDLTSFREAVLSGKKRRLTRADWLWAYINLVLVHRVRPPLFRFLKQLDWLKNIRARGSRTPTPSA